MEKEKLHFDVVIIGGGLAGLCNALHLTKFGKKVALFEKNSYPTHKVCGEYISNEVLPYLNFLAVNPFQFGAVAIDSFQLSTVQNKTIDCKLPLGGFGISRFTLDYELYKIAIERKVTIFQDTVTAISFQNNSFTIQTKENRTLKATVAIGAFGKRSTLDTFLERSFMKQKSPYLGVKIHVKGNFPSNLVALHNFKGGYCGVSKVEQNVINLCYITDFDSFKKYKDINKFQEEIVFKNAYLKSIFKNSAPLFEKPISISQISFQNKKKVENHMIMCGDTAGMIHPLCGNGMSMAIQSAQLASPLIIEFLEEKITRAQLEKQYIKTWNKQFKKRVKVGHFIAYLFRNHTISAFLLTLLQKFKFLLPIIIKQTHGKPIKL
jgi:flavin-dependent dehydrogenase